MHEFESISFPITDRIFLGEGLFETIKVAQFKPCFPKLHWQRLKNAAESLAFSFFIPFELWNQLLMNKIEQEKLAFGGIKVFLSGGVAPRGLIERGEAGQLAFQSFTFSSAAKPMRLTSSSWLRDQNNPIYHFKTINCFESIIARRQAIAQNADEVLFFNTKLHATESTCANLFIVFDNYILTPPLTDGLLAGITRSRILRLCAQANYKHKETSITKEMLFKSKAVFLTNSIQGVQYVHSLDDHFFMPSHPLVEGVRSLLDEELL